MEVKPISKTRKIISWVLVSLVTALFIMSGIVKLISPPDSEMAQQFAKFGLEGKLRLIGIGELLSAILFLIPFTSSAGVLLLSAHIGGAIATHMEHGENFYPVVVILLFMWVANYMRNPEMVSSFCKKKKTV